MWGQGFVPRHGLAIYTVSPKNNSPFACCIFDVHQPILIIFGIWAGKVKYHLTTFVAAFLPKNYYNHLTVKVIVVKAASFFWDTV